MRGAFLDAMDTSLRRPALRNPAGPPHRDSSSGTALCCAPGPSTHGGHAAGAPTRALSAGEQYTRSCPATGRSQCPEAASTTAATWRDTVYPLMLLPTIAVVAVAGIACDASPPHAHSRWAVRPLVVGALGSRAHRAGARSRRPLAGPPWRASWSPWRSPAEGRAARTVTCQRVAGASSAARECTAAWDNAWPPPRLIAGSVSLRRRTAIDRRRPPSRRRSSADRWSRGCPGSRPSATSASRSPGSRRSVPAPSSGSAWR